MLVLDGCCARRAQYCMPRALDASDSASTKYAMFSLKALHVLVNAQVALQLLVQLPPRLDTLTP